MAKVWGKKHISKLFDLYIFIFHICFNIIEARQAPLSMEFSRQEYWSREPLPSPGDLSNSAIEPESLALQADSLPSEPPEKPMNTGVGSRSLSLGDLSHSGIKPESLALQADSLPSEPSGKFISFSNQKPILIDG